MTATDFNAKNESAVKGYQLRKGSQETATQFIVKSNYGGHAGLYSNAVDLQK